MVLRIPVSKGQRLNLYNRDLFIIGVILSVLGGSGAGFALYSHNQKPSDRAVSQVYNIPAANSDTCGGGICDNPNSPNVTVTPPTENTGTGHASSSAQSRTTSNTAQCNSILAAGEADLGSLKTQVNQQLAIMKQIIANEGSGLPSQINGGGATGLVGDAQIQASYNQASSEVTALTNQIGTDRQNYVNQLENLQCWSQAGTMLNYNPSA